MNFDQALEIAVGRTGDEQLRRLCDPASGLSPWFVAVNRAAVCRLVVCWREGGEAPVRKLLADSREIGRELAGLGFRGDEAPESYFRPDGWWQAIDRPPIDQRK